MSVSNRPEILAEGSSFLSIADLSVEQVLGLVDLGSEFRSGFNAGVRDFEMLGGKTVVSLFYENSTRTRLSFERAIRLLGGEFYNFDVSDSSVAKGESLRDTAMVLEALGFSAIVMRHPGEGTANQVNNWVDIPVINAGDGCHEHPAQALGDLLTILDHHNSPEVLGGLKVCFVGDVVHSRVARSVSLILSKFGAEISFAGPPEMVSDNPYGRVMRELDDVIADVDVLYLLRVQRERLDDPGGLDLPSYVRRFQLNYGRRLKLKENVTILHPGPMNIGVEVDAYVSRDFAMLAPDQVRNGVFARMAVMSQILGGKP